MSTEFKRVEWIKQWADSVAPPDGSAPQSIDLNDAVYGAQIVQTILAFLDGSSELGSMPGTLRILEMALEKMPNMPSYERMAELERC